VRDRLLKLSRARGEDYQVILIRYAVERLLYRLTRSEHRDRFLLKGAMLFSVWDVLPHRSTRDLDLLGRGSDDPEAVRRTFTEILATPVPPDGIEFDGSAVDVEPLHEGQDYEGVRVSLAARLGVARVPLQVDVAFGQAVRPEAAREEFPSLLGMPTPTLLAYPREVVVAEKFQAMNSLGMTNSRMKDFFDIAYLADRFEFDARRLAQAVEATFQRRRTDLPAKPPLVLTRTYFDSTDRKQDWAAFLRRAGLPNERTTLADACGRIERLLMPVCEWVRGGSVPSRRWNPAGGWNGG
jgi:predicted nucleotidyltransferase component of viral defense system